MNAEKMRIENRWKYAAMTTLTLMNNWTLEAKFEGRKLPVVAHAVEGVKLVFVLLRPDMKHFRMNISWKDEVTLDRDAEMQAAAPQLHWTAKRAEDMPMSYPELISWIISTSNYHHHGPLQIMRQLSCAKGAAQQVPQKKKCG